jgi:hypothetical protein
LGFRIQPPFTSGANVIKCFITLAPDVNGSWIRNPELRIIGPLLYQQHEQ